VGEIERFNEDISGINVNAASRIQSLAAGDQVLVSSVLKSLVFGSGITFKDVGDFELKGFDEQWRLAQVITVTKP
jgi:class 3 adenylate cyclase